MRAKARERDILFLTQEGGDMRREVNEEKRFLDAGL